MTAEARDPRNTAPRMAALLNGAKVISIGIEDFASALWHQRVPCIQVDWTPAGPVQDDPEMVQDDPEMRALLDRLL